ncbi:MAG: glycosyltransferase family 39 protein, partial [Blastocatellia bacterium]
MLEILIDESIVSTKLYKIAFLVIFLVVLLNFGNIISGDFVADDIFYVVNNESIRSLFSYDLFFPKKHLFSSFNNYRPIYNFILAIEYTLFGLDSIPYHIFNIFLHTLNTFLLYLLTLKYTDNKLLALLTAIIFAVHPIHTEAVSNITGLSEVLTAFFALFAIWLYSKSNKLDIYYISSLLCYLFAILSKENGVVALGVIILLDVCYNWSNFSKLKSKFIYHSGYFLVLFLYLLLRITLRGSIVNNKNLIFPDSFSSRIYTMSIVLIKYIYLLIFPSKLIAFYDTTIIKIVNQINIEVTMALILILGLLITGFIL